MSSVLDPHWIRARLEVSVRALALASMVALLAASAVHASAPNEIYVGVAEGEIGEHLVGPDGRTLYFHAGDIYAGQSRCHAACADAWPPLTLPRGFVVEAEEGVTGPLGVIRRPDGARMVTYRGRPLYYHARDDAPGRARGHGGGGAWFAARVDGSLSLEAPADPHGDPDAPALTVERATGDTGDYLTASDGMTLYFFAGDDVPGRSECTAGCREAWPPVMVQAGETVTAGDGVFGLLRLADGDGQHVVTYDGRPLYRFAGDGAPGETNGHGVNDAWFTAAVDASLPT